jgi:aspartyl-tRNA(Asn)/glutamyl-tRNA(Gln) amidotransferase subunit C
MRLGVTDVEQLALKSRLELSEEKKAQYTEALNGILQYLDLLNQLDTTGVEPAFVHPPINVFREDKLEASLDKELALANAPEEEAGAFVVPRIV